MKLIHDLLVEYFQPCALEQMVASRRYFAHWQRPDVQRELEKILEDYPSHQFYGARIRESGIDFRFPNLLEAGEDGIAVGPAVYSEFDIGEAEPVRCPFRGLWLAESDGVRFAVVLEAEDDYNGGRARVEFAASPDAGHQRLIGGLASRLTAEVRRARCYRHKVLVLRQPEREYDVAPARVVVVPVSPVSRDEVVLPERTLALIESNTLSFARNVPKLVQLGMSPRKGVLFYGPPGTGKSYVLRYIAARMEGFTTLMLSAGEFVLLPDYLRISRALEPALVVLEDIDLIGADREGPWAAHGGALNHLLNEMDGMAEDACVVFILTTNRPEVLEPALAGRPGRVDQAVSFELPEDPERQRLIRQYSRALHVSDGLVSAVSKKVGKVSPAFIKELMRRAAQHMLERGGERDLLMVDVERAIDDMITAGGRLTAKLLGAERGMGFASKP